MYSKEPEERLESGRVTNEAGEREWMLRRIRRKTERVKKRLARAENRGLGGLKGRRKG